jgi:restriction endonuclease Mrr
LRFVRKGRARGHSPETIKKFIRVYELRKWAEEDRVRPESGWGHTRAASSPGQSNLDAPENPALAYDSLDELRRLDPYEFERFIADLFDAMGYDATAVGGTADRGIDVEIRRQDGSKWGVAQCKRYDAQNKIRTDQVLEFGGAYMLSGAERGFFLTTGVFTTHAKKTANGYTWLTTFNGAQLVNYIESINRRIEEAAQTISG